MSIDHEWDLCHWRGEFEFVPLSRAALLYAWELTEWNGVVPTDEDSAPMTSDAGHWRSLYTVSPETLVGPYREAYKSYLSTLIREVESGRITPLHIGRFPAGEIDPDRTLLKLKDVESMADTLRVDMNDMWKELIATEEMIAKAAFRAAFAARLDAEAGQLRDDEHSTRDYSKLPVWAMEEIMEYRVAAQHRSAVRADDRAPAERLDARNRRTLLNVIGALVDTMLGETPAGRKISVYASQAALIDALMGRYPHTYGLSQRQLEGLFPAARKALMDEKS